jgi:hypothetical protein
MTSLQTSLVFLQDPIPFTITQEIHSEGNIGKVIKINKEWAKSVRIATV